MLLGCQKQLCVGADASEAKRVGSPGDHLPIFKNDIDRPSIHKPKRQ